jgi:SAM-dependent methyltransferase
MKKRAWVLIGMIMAGGFFALPWASPAAAATNAPAANRGATMNQAAPVNQAATMNQAAPVPGFHEEINDKFKRPDLNVEDWRQRFENDGREVYAARQAVLRACRVQPGDRVADIGAGSGFYTLMFAQAVGPSGWVAAVEVSTRFLEFLNERAMKQGVTNITPVLGTDESINLPPDCLNLAFVCDTYHHFEYPQSTLASIRRALRAGGTLVIVDYERQPGKSSAWTLGHVRAGKEQVRQEIEAAGFQFVEEVKIPGFRETYFLRFRKTG